MSPILVPVVVLGLGFYLQFAGLGIGGTDLSLVLAHTVLVSPFVIVAVSAGLRQIDPALETAATIMGASRTRVVFKVVLPQIRGSLAVGALFAFLLSFDEVVASYFISGPATMTLPVKMYSALRWEISPVIAAVSVLLTMISLVFSLAMRSASRPIRLGNHDKARTDILNRPVPSVAERRTAIEAEPLPANIAALLDEAADAAGDRLAWTFFESGEQATYREVRADVAALARGLVACGIRKGSHVGVMLPNVAAFPLSWLAIASIGAVMVPINIAYRERELAYVLNDSEPSS